MIIADTDVLINFLRGKGAINEVSEELKQGRLFTTVITVFELWAGVRNDSQRKSVDKLQSALVIIPLEPNAARTAGEIRRTLEKDGEGIGMADSLIAGICLTHNGTLLTNNKKHFQRVPNLKLMD